jgi:hypothetical protein
VGASVILSGVWYKTGSNPLVIGLINQAAGWTACLIRFARRVVIRADAKSSPIAVGFVAALKKAGFSLK